MESVKIQIDNENDLFIVKKGKLVSPYIFVIPFRNQVRKIERCLQSILNQKNIFKIKFEILLIDDASSDGSLEVVRKYLDFNSIEFTLISNKKRKWKTRNLYNAVHLIDADESVIIEFDGDDFVPTDVDLLKILDQEYKNDCLKTFGSFEIFSDDGRYSPYFTELTTKGIPHDTDHVWDSDKCVSWAPLRSYKVKLFKAVPIDCFLEKDTKNWLKMGEDEIIHPMMSEIAGKNQVSFISEKIYVYDISGEEHDINFIHNRNYLTFKLLMPPKSLLKNDLREKFNSYEEACEFTEKNKKTLIPAISKITPLLCDFQNDDGFTLWGSGWHSFTDGNVNSEGTLTRNLSNVPPINTVFVDGESVKCGHLFGFVGSDKNNDRKRYFFIMMQTYFTGYSENTSFDADLSSNIFVKSFLKTGASGLKVSLMVGKKYDQTYSIRINKSGIKDYDQFFVPINDKDIPLNKFKEFILPFPQDGPVSYLHGLSCFETDLVWARAGWGKEKNEWSRNDFFSISISSLVQGIGVDVYINKIEFY